MILPEPLDLLFSIAFLYGGLRVTPGGLSNERGDGRTGTRGANQ